MGVWGGLIFVLSVMRVVGGVPLWVVWLECCRHLHTLYLHNLCPQRWGPDSVFFGQAGHRSHCFHCATHRFDVSFNFRSLSKVQGCVRRGHCSMCVVVSGPCPHAHDFNTLL